MVDKLQQRKHSRVLRHFLWLHKTDICMYAGKAEWLLLFLTQHTRKSIGSKEAVFHGVHFRPCLLCLCVSITSLTSVAAVCFPHASSHVRWFQSPHPLPFFLNQIFHVHSRLFFLFCFKSFLFFASPIPNHANSCTCFCNISKFTDQFFFLWSLLCFSTIFVDFFLCLIFILKFKKQLNGVQEQQDPSPPLTHTSHSFLQDHTSPGPQLQSQCPGRSSQASPPYPVLPLTHHQLLR